MVWNPPGESASGIRTARQQGRVRRFVSQAVRRALVRLSGISGRLPPFQVPTVSFLLFWHRPLFFRSGRSRRGTRKPSLGLTDSPPFQLQWSRRKFCQVGKVLRMFRWSVLLLFLLLNLFAYGALRRSVVFWVNLPEQRRKFLYLISLVVFLLNIPLLLFFVRRSDVTLLQVSPTVLKILFYPATAWLATLLIFFVVAGPPTLVWALMGSLSRIFRRGRREKTSVPASPSPLLLSRRGFLAGSTGLLIPGIYGLAAYGVYGNLEELEISPERSIPIPHLPRSLEGLKIVQLSDLHVGPYIREKELRHLVSLTNQLHADVVVITGDQIDRDLASLPDMVRGLADLQSSLGTFAVLGNHDISSDRYSSSKQFRGGIHIVRGLESIGIRTLRNEVVSLGSGADRLVLMGLDWPSVTPGGQGFFSYQPEETRRQLRRLDEEAGPETPRVLLAHHPDTFTDAMPFEIGLTLAGHTHGGGQVILGSMDGVPIGIAMFRFKYLSGLYQENHCSLYVNRGIGYLGIPIRINCPPEISRFRLTRPASA